eukprot:CAMPEP_0184482594 /NCGR_PEP_ID=MMETSP0113_2-20130426/4162_1 /TAXON_ID=91329 /ORGANISM="Norrisiella sphaerica, Strain BC52" /LENGTH=287 /DNA_ID=CAMNT_0026862423 /DNA_START=142 /DNA_END=1005 /DNA_ORIENTATION=-
MHAGPTSSGRKRLKMISKDVIVVGIGAAGLTFLSTLCYKQFAGWSILYVRKGDEEELISLVQSLTRLLCLLNGWTVWMRMFLLVLILAVFSVNCHLAEEFDHLQKKHHIAEKVRKKLALELAKLNGEERSLKKSLTAECGRESETLQGQLRERISATVKMRHEVEKQHNAKSKSVKNFQNLQGSISSLKRKLSTDQAYLCTSRDKRRRLEEKLAYCQKHIAELKTSYSTMLEEINTKKKKMQKHLGDSEKMEHTHVLKKTESLFEILPTVLGPCEDCSQQKKLVIDT